MECIISKSSPPHGRQSDPRFALHQRQPRADKLDAHQRRLCVADPAFREALRRRVKSPERFSAFLDGAAYYIALERPCAKCGNFKKRTRDRSCYRCHLDRGWENFERMRAGLAPQVARTIDSHLDLLGRRRAERDGDFIERDFENLRARRFPLGRLEVTFPDGHLEHDLNKLSFRELENALAEFPSLKDVFRWAGWA